MKATPGASADSRTMHLEVAFEPACVMPGRFDVPQWLKGQILTVRREADHPREIGDVGDSIVLTPAESADWLYPLRIDPAVTCGQLPADIRVELRWWKDDEPGEFAVCANGRRRAGAFTPARDGDEQDRRYVATVSTAEFFDHAPSLPVDVVATFGELEAACTVLPAEGCCYHKLWTAGGPRHLVRSAWYDVEVCPERGGGISALREAGRRVDHFQADETLIGRVFDYGGHTDVARLGWSDKLGDTAMTSVTARRESQACRLCLEGAVDDCHLRTTVAYTVFDDLSLVLIQRDVARHKGDKKNKDKRPDRAREPIDDVQSLGLGFCAAYRVESAPPASRILSLDDGRLAAVRHCRTHDSLHDGWRPGDGWIVVEHPQRRECMMYAFDSHNAPELHTWLGERVLKISPAWLPRPAAPNSGTGFALAVSAGEVCGASVVGAWVACRRPVEGGVACALVGRFGQPADDMSVTFRMGAVEARAGIERLMTPGVGDVHVAAATLAEARMDQPFTAMAGNVPARSAQ